MAKQKASRSQSNAVKASSRTANRELTLASALLQIALAGVTGYVGGATQARMTPQPQATVVRETYVHERERIEIYESAKTPPGAEPPKAQFRVSLSGSKGLHEEIVDIPVYKPGELLFKSATPEGKELPNYVKIEVAASSEGPAFRSFVLKDTLKGYITQNFDITKDEQARVGDLKAIQIVPVTYIGKK